MGRIIVGIILFVLGLATLADPEAETIWTGGMIVGVMLTVSGIKSRSQSKKTQVVMKSIEEREQDLTTRLRQGEAIDRIAADYYSAYGIPPSRLLLVAAQKVVDLSSSDRESDRQLARNIAARQHIDSVTPPAQYLATLAFDRTVFYVEQAVKAHTSHPSAKQPVEGTLILTKAYLYFIADTKPGTLSKVGGRIVDKAADVVPYFGILTGGASLVSGLSDELRDYFRPGNLEKLKARFSSPVSFAVPLARLTGVREMTHKWTITSTTYLELKVGGHEPAGAYWMETGRMDESQWVAEWKERLQLACVGEGNLFGASKLVLPT